MTNRFDVRWEGELPGSPRDAWEAVTARAGAYLWPIRYEPRVGGSERGLTRRGGTVTVWAPHRHFRTEAGPEDGFNCLDYEFEPRGERTFLRLRHVAEWYDDDFDVQLASCLAHTDFYHHSLGQYLGHFAGQDARYVPVDAPASSSDGGTATLRRALGIADEVQPGDDVVLRAPGIEPITGVVDYVAGTFVGVRTSASLVRIYGRDAWGWPVSVAHHLFDPAIDAAEVERTWQALLDGIFTTEAVAR